MAPRGKDGKKLTALDHAVDDPVTALIFMLLPLLIAAVVFYNLEERHRSKPVKIPEPPVTWVSKPTDRLAVPGYTVGYWLNPKARHSRAASRKIRGIVVHWTKDGPPLAFVKYGHRIDRNRRPPAAYGYHFYVDKKGKIYQGAPLSKRTNHIKRPGHSARRRYNLFASNSNAIGVSMVGSCGMPKGLERSFVRCVREDVTFVQRASTLAVVAALQRRYDLPCHHIWGHGELQYDRNSKEGLSVAKSVRNTCVAPTE